ncbi:MAG: dockerin type I domain-containing protein [Clostridiales bacterium]|nr:dockerin type I domain-containing protein [Clostridiales bacterium]
MKLKRILGLLGTLVGVGIFSVCAYAGTMAVEDVSGTAGSQVNVNVYISPSTDGTSETLNAFVVNLAYDNTVLTPVSTGTDVLSEDLYATAADSISSGVFVAAPTSEEGGTLAVAWANGDAVTYSEKTLLFTAAFEIAEDASAGTSNLTLTVTQLATDPETLVDDSTEYTGTVTISDSSFTRGDANGDGDVDSSDASLILRSKVGLDTISSANEDKADANNDGDIDSSDASLILRSKVGLDTISN